MPTTWNMELGQRDEIPKITSILLISSWRWRLNELEKPQTQGGGCGRPEAVLPSAPTAPRGLREALGTRGPRWSWRLWVERGGPQAMWGDLFSWQQKQSSFETGFIACRFPLFSMLLRFKKFFSIISQWILLYCYVQAPWYVYTWCI